MKEIYTNLRPPLLCSLVSMAQNTDAMLFGDVKAKEGGKHLSHAVIPSKRYEP